MASVYDLVHRAKATRSSNSSEASFNTYYNDFDDFDQSSDDLMVIGIDFGTTYSGVAWATVADFRSNQINIINRWPGTGREEGKAPTALFYENDQISWGYGVPDDGDPISWFKLLLQKEEDLAPELRSSDYVLRGRKMLRQNGKTAVDLVTDYLRELWKHVLDEITKARGENVIDALQIHVVITLPAIWKGYARQGMQEAVQKAGILDDRDAGETKLSFAPEPEAAALSTLCEPGRRVNKGDTYIICDAGGGTVDLISYEIESSRPLAVREVTEGTGGLCGGIFIDEAFELMCMNRLGRGWDRLSKIGIKKIMKGEWEYAIKPEFSLKSKAVYIVDIPAEAFPTKAHQTDTSREPVIKNGRMHFKQSTLQTVFTEVFAAIENLIDDQIKFGKSRGASIAGIILVEGLGSSPYLYETLQAKYARQGMHILQAAGTNSRTAISRGAVYKGFLNQDSSGGDIQEKLGTIPISITSTVSRASFGSEFGESFQKGRHLDEDKVWQSDEAKWKAINQIHWYLRRGDDVSISNPVRIQFYRTFRQDFGKLSTVIYQCTDITAPSRKIGSVTPLCRIEWTPHISFADLEWTTNTLGEKYKILNFEFEFKTLGATAEFAVYVKGVKQGGEGSSVTIQHDT